MQILSEDAEGHVKTSRSEIAQNLGVLGLTHYTDISNLPKILRANALQSARDAGLRPDSYAPRFVNIFVSFLLDISRGESLNFPLSSSYRNKNGVEIFSLDRALLVFDTEVLERDDYHMIPDHAYGQESYGLEKASYPKDIAIFLEDLKDSGKRNEVVFRNEISMDHLREIWVHPSQLESTLRLLRDNGILSIGGNPIEAVVVPRTRIQ